MNSLSDIINNPDYVFYDKSKNGLEYYKRINYNILVAVRVNKGRELKVYPVEDIKIRRKKEEQMKLYNKYVVSVE